MDHLYSEKDLDIRKVISEIDKNQAEMRKALAETSLIEKKIKWYEVVMFITAGVAMGGIIAKLFF